MKLGYLVHDLTDPAVTKRVRMLQAGGASVRLAGFRRDQLAGAGEAVDGILDLGRTYDARMVHRAGATLVQSLRGRALARAMGQVEVLIARNLEMLAIAAAIRAHAPTRPALVYEALDIHRLMLGSKPWSAGLRLLERSLLARTDALMVSSPAFIDRYFNAVQQAGAHLRNPPLLVENKVLSLKDDYAAAVAPPPPGPPWRIGWFGMIRCRKSLDLLCDVARRRPDLIEVDIRGRPARTEFADFDGQVAAAPTVTDGGPYRAEDLPRMYGAVHFNWAIDYFEEGANSEWLLPNRLYEGGLHQTPALASARTETGRWLTERGLGVRFDDPVGDLESFLEGLTSEDYLALRDRSASAPAAWFACTPADCADLVETLRRLPATTLSAVSGRGLPHAPRAAE